MLLEEMRIPYAMKTIPLTDYMKPGQTKPAEYLKLCPDGLVPAIQLAIGDSFCSSRPMRGVEQTI